MADNRISIGLSVTGADGADARQDTTHIPIHFLRDHVPKAISRFASPSCPWPWAGDAEADEQHALEHGYGSRPPSRFPSRAPSVARESGPTHLFQTSNWDQYPHDFFPNWDSAVQDRCGMTNLFQAEDAPLCKIYPVDICNAGKFRQSNTVIDHTDMADPLRPTNAVAEFLDGQRDERLHMRCLCVENLSGNVLKMLGAHYRIEPFFFSSSINRIPSRYHENLGTVNGDHMYITLPFLRLTKERNVAGFADPSITSTAYGDAVNIFAPLELVGADTTIKNVLQQDMLAVLLVRAENNNTIITVHPGPVPHSARTLAHRLMSAGLGVYWNNLLQNTHDPIFVLLIVMWSAIYAWDEAMAALGTHATYLEDKVIKSNIQGIEYISPQVHRIRSQLLWYDDLLDQFKKSLEFIQKAGAKSPPDTDEEKKEEVKQLLKKEIRTLTNEVDRLMRQRVMLDDRLGHVMKLVVSILQIKEASASQLHSQSMKQLTYLTTVYLPASFIATVFGMNVKEIVPDSLGTLHKYFAVMIPLTIVTIWLAGLVTVRVEQPDAGLLRLVFWPTFLFLDRAGQLYTIIRDNYFHWRENLRQPKETLKDLAVPLPKPRGRSRVRDSSHVRTSWVDVPGNGNISNGHAYPATMPSMASVALGGSSGGVLVKNRHHDVTPQWSNRQRSVASSKVSRRTSFEHTSAMPVLTATAEHAPRSREQKILEASDGDKYEAVIPMQSMPPHPIITRSPPSGPVIPSSPQWSPGGAGDGGRPGSHLSASPVSSRPSSRAQGLARYAVPRHGDTDSRMLRPTQHLHAADVEYGSRSDLARSEYARSDVSTRASTPTMAP